ncbi:transposase [Asaia siamensis]
MNRIERMFNRFKNWRRVATRYVKTAQSCLGFVSIASVFSGSALSTSARRFGRRS